MTNEQILEKAIEKAVKNGWKTKDGKGFVLGLEKYWLEGNSHYSIIFSHDFANAFWGEEYNSITVVPDHYDYYHDECYKIDKDWKFHLQQLVLEKDPIKYLKKFL